MEAFTDLDAESYLKNHPFRCPGGTGTNLELCIAVTSSWGHILTAFYSVLATLLFTYWWQIVVIGMISVSVSLEYRMEATDSDTFCYELGRERRGAW